MRKVILLVCLLVVALLVAVHSGMIPGANKEFNRFLEMINDAKLNSDIIVMLLAVALVCLLIAEYFPYVGKAVHHVNKKITYLRFRRILRTEISNHAKTDNPKKIEKDALRGIYCGIRSISQLRSRDLEHLSTCLFKFVNDTPLDVEMADALRAAAKELSQRDLFHDVPERERDTILDILNLMDDEHSQKGILSGKLMRLGDLIKELDKRARRAEGKSMGYAFVGIGLTILFGAASILLGWFS